METYPLPLPPNVTKYKANKMLWKGLGNIICVGIQVGVGGSHTTGKGRGWGNIMEREPINKDVIAKVQKIYSTQSILHGNLPTPPALPQM